MEANTRRHICALSLLLTVAMPMSASAQSLSSESGSNSAANSGSASQAASQSNPTNINNPVNHQGNLSSTSGSTSNSASGSSSGSTSDQNQSQNSSNNLGQSQLQGQTATNQQGVAVNFNSTTSRTQKVYTNNAVPLAASSSFSSDYCGGTASGGASSAPLGISIGGAGPVFDKSCQSLRRAEKFGMAAANASNMGQPELAGRLMSMMIWSICTSDTNGPKADKATAQACDNAGLLGSSASSQPEPARAPEPITQTPAGYPSPEATSRDLSMAQTGHDNPQRRIATEVPHIPSALPMIELAAIK